MLQRETSTYTLPGLIDYQYKRTSNHGIAVYLGNISRIQIRTDVVTSIDNLLSRVRMKKKNTDVIVRPATTVISNDVYVRFGCDKSCDLFSCVIMYSQQIKQYTIIGRCISRSAHVFVLLIHFTSSNNRYRIKF